MDMPKKIWAESEYYEWTEIEPEGDSKFYGSPAYILESEHLALLEAVQWQPIETAPKLCQNWEYVLVNFPGKGMAVARWGFVADNDEGWIDIWGEVLVSWNDDGQPTHWMPLPPQPSAP